MHDQSDSIRLAEFPRRNLLTGAPEWLRIETGDFNGHYVTHLRIWYSTRPKSVNDDGSRPTKVGVTLREVELDRAIEALEEARRIVHAEGRETNNGQPASSMVKTTRPSNRKPRNSDLETGRRDIWSRHLAHDDTDVALGESGDGLEPEF